MFKLAAISHSSIKSAFLVLLNIIPFNFKKKGQELTERFAIKYSHNITVTSFMNILKPPPLFVPTSRDTV